MPITITPKHKAIEQYYVRLHEIIEQQGVFHESAVRPAFQALLERVGKEAGWTLLTELDLAGLKHRAVPDGTMRDEFRLAHGYWEAKDSKDDLEAEIIKKLNRNYPTSNIIFEDARRAIFYQYGKRVGEFQLANPDELADLLTRFLSFSEPTIEEFHAAVEKFKTDTKGHAESLALLIQDAHRTNPKFKDAYAEFFELCKTALNPNIRQAAVDEMLIQHLLTERLMRTVLDNPDFVRRNVIAAEVEKVIDALTSKSFSRTAFLGKLDYFYKAIEGASQNWTEFADKQAFINTVYERFFQGYAVKVADTHGIVYTPQPIVDFMCAAVEEVLRDEFNLGLADEQVCIIDPATGTGNFMINLLHRIHRTAPHRLPDVYKNRLFANEVMLLPYYVASLNIEHAYYDLTETYEPFEGLCFVDTLDLAEGRQMTYITEKNSERVARQKQAPITVIIGNPPYNVGQLNENDNNKNRKYKVIDASVKNTYARDGLETLKTKYYNAYVKFIRWATDRLEGRDGIVCYISNNSFVHKLSGVRQHLFNDFNLIYHLDLHGDVRDNPKLSGTKHNVFGIQDGVGITIAIRTRKYHEHRIFYHRVPEFWTKEEKFGFLRENLESNQRENSLNTIEWKELIPDTQNNWLILNNVDQFTTFIPLGSKRGKKTKAKNVEAIFKTFSLGVSTNRDNVVYDFDLESLANHVDEFAENYNSEVHRYSRKGMGQKLDDFLNYGKVKWSATLKAHLSRGNYAEFSKEKIRESIYRPFCKQYLFYDKVFVDRPALFQSIFPTEKAEFENICIWLKIGKAVPFFSLAINLVPNLLPQGGSQCFPFYVYDEDGSNRRENITDWALGQFRAQYGDEGIGKWDVFYYVYGLLHHPAYRTRYADNLKRELPRIPYAPYFWAFAKEGKTLANLHLNYEAETPYELGYEWTAGRPVSYEVKKMRLSRDKTALVVNDSLTLTGIPAAAFEYRLGNRSALDWVIDQYQVKEDKRSGIRSDPNLYSEDAKYIVELVGRVVAVSVATVGIVAGLPELGVGE